jgi:peptidoglycan DL-endopeptidase CwlO
MNFKFCPQIRFVCTLFLAFLLINACSHRPSIRYTSRLSRRVYKALQPNIRPARIQPKSVIFKASVSAETAESTLQYMASLVGQPYAKRDGKSYRGDCSGTTRAIYDSLGISLGYAPANAGDNDATTIYNSVEKNGVLDQKNIAPLDLVFFDDTYDRNNNGKLDDKLTHVGVVEKILPDKTILFVHFMGKSIIRSRMNLLYPNLQHHPQSKERVNHLLRRASKKHKGFTAAKLFVGFGRFNLNNQLLSSATSDSES